MVGFQIGELRMERQREASGTLGSRPINASVSDKRKGEVALPLPLLSGGFGKTTE